MAMRPAGRGGRRPSTAATPSRQGFGGGVQMVYEDFKPMSEWQQDKDSDVLIIYLPGFQKQNLKVSTEGQDIVRARGDRLDAGNKWSQFQEDYKVPERCDIRAVRATFEGGFLTITMPWKKEYHHQTHQEAQPIRPPPSVEEAPPKKATSSSPVAPKTESPTTTIVKPPKDVDDKFVDAAERPEPKKFVPQKDKPSEELSPSPLPTSRGSSGKLKDEKLSSFQLYDPLPQKGGNHEQKKKPLSTDPPVQDTSAAILPPKTIGDHVENKDESTRENKENFTKPENPKRPKEDEGKYAADDKMERVNRNKDVLDGGDENVARGLEKQVMMTTPGTTGAENRLRNYKEALRKLAGLNEERQLLVNVGAAVLVIVALGTYIITSTAA